MNFSNLFSRNIGLISKKEQKQISNSSILICGVGGMGGVCAEALVRMGVGRLFLVDHDIFEDTNINRQIHSNKKTTGKTKVSVLKKEFLKINPKLKINILSEKVSLDNVNKIIEKIDVVVNGMDDMNSSLILEREARRRKITIVDAWITPFASVFVMDNKSPHWEYFLNLPSKNVKENNFSKKMMNDCLKKEIDFTFSHFDPYSYISKEKVNNIIKDKIKRPSFVIVVWMSGILMANEVFKVVTGKKNVGYKGIFYNQYTHEIIEGKIPRNK